jgi:hypothetical protein
MSPDRSLLGATLLITIGATTVLADPPHQGGLPPGLQSQLERGYPLLLAWRDRASQSGYGYGYGDDDDDDDDDDDSYGYSDQDRYGYGSVTPYDDPYAAEPVEDTVYRIIQDVSDLTERLSR